MKQRQQVLTPSQRKELHLGQAQRDSVSGLEDVADGESLWMRLRTMVSLTNVFVISILIGVTFPP